MASNNVKENDLERLDTGNNHIDKEEQLRNVLTNTMTMSPQLFESLYLQPKTQVAGDLRKTFANPTPVAVMGFVVGLLPLSIEFSMLC